MLTTPIACIMGRSGFCLGAIMGWKNVKDYYDIDAIVHVKRESIWIGLNCLVNISIEGELLSAKCDDYGEDLRRVVKEMRSDPEKLLSLVTSPDQFGPLTTVWAYDRNSLIEKQCEIVGWPNCCTDGEMQNDNTHSHDRAIVIRWAIENARARLEQAQRFWKQAEELVEVRRKESYEAEDDLNKLEAIYE
jgi:hypothetical protein